VNRIDKFFIGIVYDFFTPSHLDLNLINRKLKSFLFAGPHICRYIMVIRNWLRTLSRVSILVLTGWLWPQVAGACEHSAAPVFLSGFQIGALGDFDGDHKPDIAVAVTQRFVNGRYRYRVEVRLSAIAGSMFDVDALTPGGLQLHARDIDGDHLLDLVITSALDRELVGVWINDGHGNFSPGPAGMDTGWFRKEAGQSADAPLDEYPRAPALAGSQAIAPRAATRVGLFNRLAVVSRTSNAGATLDRLNPGSPLRAPPISSELI
jgi:hypothetical protein